MKPDWNSVHLLSSNTSDQWRHKFCGGKIIENRDHLDKAVAKWHPMQSLMISVPNSKIFLPVLSIDEYRLKAHKSAKSSQIMLFVMTAVSAIFTFILYVFNNDDYKLLTLSIVSLIFFSLFISEYFLIFRRVETLEDRSKFIAWVCKFGGMNTKFWFVVMLFIGLIQYALQCYFDGWEPMMYRFGLIYKSVFEGEWWRLFLGPYFHSGVTHWITNMVMLIFYAAIVNAFSERYAIAVFVVGNIAAAASALALNTLGDAGSDAYVGVSGGAYALLGWIIGVAVLEKYYFPAYFYASISLFGVAIFLSTWLMLPHASNSGHLGGLLVGIILSFFLKIKYCAVKK